ncbi:MAG TPA: hypothetical protein ENN85_02840 [Methanoculleus sp.]|nr:hypothetical protein [Methanoculleus sp.]
MADDGDGIPPTGTRRSSRGGMGKTGYGQFLAPTLLDIIGMAIRETGQEGKGARFEIVVPADR